MSHGGMTGLGRGHAVSFHALDSEGIGAVARFVADGWDLDECVVVVSTVAHRSAVEAELVARGHDPASRARDGRYLALDADEILRDLVVDGRVDAGRFLARADEVFTRASAAGVPVRAFGELVALLWEQDEIDAAIELELLWNQLLRAHTFSLLCAYPTGVLDRAQLVDVRRVCDLHTEVVPVVPDGPADTEAAAVSHRCSRVYLPIPESVPAARHFVVSVLRAWGHDALAADAALIVSELATNALRHAATPFRAVVDRRRGELRIGVEDATNTPVDEAHASLEDVTGRGVAIVAALSERWGHSAVPGGKVVWAELPLDPEGSRAG